MEDIKKTNNKLLIPLVVAIIGILILAISIFLPYMTAVGEWADHIEEFSDVVVLEEQNVTYKDLAKVPFISVSKLIESVWGEDDAQITEIFLLVFGSFAILTTVFIFIKKPVIGIICVFLTSGTFLLLSILIKEDFIGANKYVWGVGYFVTLIAVIVIFVGLVLMLVSKILNKKKYEQQ